MPDLDAELERAVQWAISDRVARLFSGVGRRAGWGLACVEYYGDHRSLYEPQPDGVVALIVPVVEGGELIDLAAIDGITDHVGQRLGLGRGLGFDAIERARWRCIGDRDSTGTLLIEPRALLLHQRALHWLLDPVDAVYLFDLRRLEIVLAHAGRIAARSPEFAERIASLLPPSQRGRVMVRARKAAAA